MPFDVKVPTVGESITSGTLGSWRRTTGDFVQEGDVLFEIETDKVTSEVFAPGTGILEQLVQQGTEVQIGQVVGRIQESTTSPPAKTAPATPAQPATDQPAPAPVVTTTPKVEQPLSPAVRRLVEEHELSPGEINGTGKAGRLTKGDVLNHLEAQAVKAPAATPVPSTPILPSLPQVATQPATEGARFTRRKMTPLRKKIADRLVSAQRTAAILTTFNEVDLTNVMALRAKFQERFVAKHGTKLGFMSIFVKAVLHALKVIPLMNARIEGDEVVECHFYDIGVAIGTEKGLLVPIIRDADRLSLAGIEKQIAEFAQRARAGKIKIEDLEGGTFTISNGGVYGSMLSTPILNPLQSGILGMHSITERPVAVNGRVEIRPMMYLAVSYDHRLLDGKNAVTFLVTIKEFIENPGVALLEI